MGKRSTLYPLSFVTIICIHYIFNALAYLELSAPSSFGTNGPEKLRAHVSGKRSGERVINTPSSQLDQELSVS